MIASYPMYYLPQLQASLDGWWQHVLRHLHHRKIKVNVQLSNEHTDLYRHWLDPHLFFSQTCGFPLATALQRKVKLIGTPAYDSEFCKDAYYCSLLIVRSTDGAKTIEDFAGRRFAYNGPESQSGFNAVRTYLKDCRISTPFFGQNILTGQHRNSIAKVVNDEADICAVDCVTYTLLKRHQPGVLDSIRVLTTTAMTPGLPFITSVDTPEEITRALHDSIRQTCMDKSLQRLRSDLLIKDISRIPLDEYMLLINSDTQSSSKL